MRDTAAQETVPELQPHVPYPLMATIMDRAGLSLHRIRPIKDTAQQPPAMRAERITMTRIIPSVIAAAAAMTFPIKATPAFKTSPVQITR